MDLGLAQSSLWISSNWRVQRFTSNKRGVCASKGNAAYSSSHIGHLAQFLLSCWCPTNRMVWAERDLKVQHPPWLHLMSGEVQPQVCSGTNSQSWHRTVQNIPWTSCRRVQLRWDTWGCSGFQERLLDSNCKGNKPVQGKQLLLEVH